MSRKQMSRGKGLAKISAKRLAEFEAQGIYPTSTFKPKPPKMATAKRPNTGFAPEVADAILERDGHACGRCGGALWGERGLNYSIQHRRARGSGGTERPDTNMPQNGLALCGSGTTGCHGHVESHRDEARDNGWAVRQNKDPLRVAVIHFLHGRVFLYSNGSWGSRPEVSA